MTITPFGLIFITLGFTLLVARPAWLLPLLIVSAVLHAFAVAIIGPAKPGVGIGISPWLFTSGLTALDIIFRLIRTRKLDIEIPRSLKFIFYGWTLYTVWCLISAFTMPFIFKGLPVHLLISWEGFAIPMEPLVWTISNGVQVVNTIVIYSIMIYALQLAKDQHAVQRLTVGFALAAVISVGLGIYQRLALRGIAPPATFLIESLNPSYQQNLMVNYLGAVGLNQEYYRLNWPFSEPSYSSTWFSGVFVGGVAVILRTNRLVVGLLLVILGLAGLINSLGGSGLAGAAIGTIVIFVASIIMTAKRNSTLLGIVLLRLLFVIVTSLVLFHIYDFVRIKYLPNVFDIKQIIMELFRERIAGLDTTRVGSNFEALGILRDTWGLGVGLGSNRASSYLLGMLSNVGIIGFILFMTTLLTQSLTIARSTFITERVADSFILGGTVGVFFSVTLGIPDINFPAWWIWIIGGWLISSCNIIQSAGTRGK